MYLGDHLLNTSVFQRLANNLGIKYVARRILGVLDVLHADYYVHTDTRDRPSAESLLEDK